MLFERWPRGSGQDGTGTALTGNDRSAASAVCAGRVP